MWWVRAAGQGGSGGRVVWMMEDEQGKVGKAQEARGERIGVEGSREWMEWWGGGGADGVGRRERQGYVVERSSDAVGCDGQAGISGMRKRRWIV